MDSMVTQDLVSVKCKPGTLDIFAYKMYHSFWCTAGIGRLIFSALFLAIGFATIGDIDWYLTVIVLFIGMLNVVVTPLLYLYQASKAANASIPITYTFRNDVIVANDGKNRVELPWSSLPLVVLMRKEMFIYTSAVEALVLPRRQLDGKDAEVLHAIETSSNPNRTVKCKVL